MWSRSSGSESQNLESEPNSHELSVISEPCGKAKSNRSSHSTQRSVDTSHSHVSFASSSGSRANSFKRNTISSGTLLRQDTRTAQVVSPQPPSGEVPVNVSYGLYASPINTVPMASKLDTDRLRVRRERNFVGGQCAACDEPLEHTLSGEKIIQFSCGHVAHEVCLYEHIKGAESQYCPTCDEPLSFDSSRGGHLLDLNKLTSMIRSISQTPREMTPARGSVESSKSWEGRKQKEKERDREREDDRFEDEHDSRDNVHELSAQERDQRMIRTERRGLNSGRHSRSRSDGNLPEPRPESGIFDMRKHDFDLHAMESSLPRLNPAKNIPTPKVTIRSEFPTLTRSSHQQSLTCLITVEVPSSRTKIRLTGPPRRQSLPRVSGTTINTSVSQDKAPRRGDTSKETEDILNAIAGQLKERVDNWHGLEFEKFGRLRLHGTVQVGKDGYSWQQLECYLFSELLVCLKEKKATVLTLFGERTKFSLKGSILVKRHLMEVQPSPSASMLTLNLQVAALPSFHLRFSSPEQFELWNYALSNLDVSGPALHQPLKVKSLPAREAGEWGKSGNLTRQSSTATTSHDSPRTGTTPLTDFSDQEYAETWMNPAIHVPIDIIVVIPVSSSMQGLKIKLLQDALRFLISNLGDRDRMGLVTFGSNGGALPLVGMTNKIWAGWDKVISKIKPIGQKSLRADAVEGANAAIDLLVQRKSKNPITSVLLISDSPTCDSESLDYVVQRAEATKVSIFTFGLGQTHKPDNLIELSARTKASYIYVKEWPMIRECVAGCLGSLQSVSHLSAKIKLKLPEGSPAKFVKISGALATTKRSTGRDAEALIGDLRFGDKRDILVQLSINTGASHSEKMPQDHWESIVSGLEALSGALEDTDTRPESVEEAPLIQADLSFGDLGKDCATSQLSQPSLLVITILPESPKSRHSRKLSVTPPIPSHPSIVQRRMELLTSDMLTRALTLVSRQQHERAQTLLTETRTILQGIGKGNLPPLPSTVSVPSSDSPRKSISASSKESNDSPRASMDDNRSSGAQLSPTLSRATNVDSKIMEALYADIDSCLEYIGHPAVFAHDARKAALQTIGVISSQRGYAFRTATESFWADRLPGVKRLANCSSKWRVSGDHTVAEE